MNALSFLSALGLTSLGCGVTMVNLARSPRLAQCGAITAGGGVLLLALAAVGQLVR